MPSLQDYTNMFKGANGFEKRSRSLWIWSISRRGDGGCFIPPDHSTAVFSIGGTLCCPHFNYRGNKARPEILLYVRVDSLPFLQRAYFIIKVFVHQRQTAAFVGRPAVQKPFRHGRPARLRISGTLGQAVRLFSGNFALPITPGKPSLVKREARCPSKWATEKFSRISPEIFP